MKKPTGKLDRKLDVSLLSGAIATSAIKVFSAAANYALLILLARLMPVEAYGQFGILFSASIFVASALICGQPVLILRTIPQYTVARDPARVEGATIFGTLVIGGAALVFLLALFAAYAAGWLPDVFTGWMLVGVFALLTVLTAVSDFTCNLLRALGHPLLALIPRDVFWRVVAMLTIGLLATVETVDLLSALFVLAVLLAAVVVFQTMLILRIRPRAARPVFERRAWAASSAYMALGSLLFGASLTVDTMIVGALLPAEEVAVYFSAVRTATASSLLLVGLRIIAAPLLARLHYGADPAGLRQRLLMIYGLSVATSAVFALVAFVLAWPVMRLFGAEFAEGADAFRILVVGFAVANAGGISSVVLEATGHERRNALTLLATQVGTAVLVFLLARDHGLVGAAAAKATGLTIEALLLGSAVWDVFGRRRAGGGA